MRATIPLSIPMPLPHPPLRLLLRRAARVLALVLVAAGGAGGTLLAWVASDLPRFDALLDYRPKEATRVLGAGGELVAVFAEERRTVVPPEEIPAVLRQAIISAEDAGFYEHEGLSYSGIARAFLKNVTSGETRQGASTITQQVVKTFLLSPERTYSRKLKEIILARRIEQNLSKDEILYLYLNQIYFGHRRYGVQEASRFFFGKEVKALDLGEAALLAGLPQSPARLSPFDHPEACKRRQVYVLGQLLRNGFITQPEHDREVARPLHLPPRPEALPGPYYAEEVRRQLLLRYGEEVLLTGGLTVRVGMDPRLQRAADRAVVEALQAYDRRHGYRGTLGQVTEEQRTAAEARLRKQGAGAKGSLVDVQSGKLRTASTGRRLTGVVESVSAREAVLWFGGATATLPAAEAAWAKKPLPELLERDALILVEVVRVEGDRVVVALSQEPEVEGALVAIDPATRAVRALVGGYDFKRSSFNRATQARRQPGSAFKPFVYGAALESTRWTAASLVADAPETFRDPWTGQEWKPQNYDRAFEGTITLRRAVSQSKNTVPVRLISELGVEPVIDFARRAGIGGELPRSYTLALGTGEVTPLELANAYTTLDAGGLFAEPVLIEEVVGRDGEVLERAAVESRPAFSPAVSYIVTSLLRAVVTEGTGHAAGALARPTAGKTGTTSGGTDAWFAGYTPELVAVSWVGHDDAEQKLGAGEAGGRTALPAWLDVMRVAHSARPIADFPVPEGVELAGIDPATGLLAADGAPAELQPFLPGTAPTERAVAPGKGTDDTPSAIFLEEDDRKEAPR